MEVHMARARYAKVAPVTQDTEAVRIDWIRGDASEFDPAELSQSIQRMLMLHGLKQKLVDAYNTKAEDVDDARRIAQEVWDMLRGGAWSARPEGTGGILVEALMRVKGVDRATAKAAVDGLSKDDRKRVEANAAVKAAKAAIMAERAAAAADAAGDADDGDELEIPGI